MQYTITTPPSKIANSNHRFAHSWTALAPPPVDTVEAIVWLDKLEGGLVLPRGLPVSVVIPLPVLIPVPVALPVSVAVLILVAVPVPVAVPVLVAVPVPVAVVVPVALQVLEALRITVAIPLTVALPVLVALPLPVTLPLQLLPPLPLLPLCTALFIDLTGEALATGGRMLMPAAIAFASPTALEAVASGTTVWVAKGPSTVVVGESCAGGWSVSIESDGLVRDGLLLELELKPVG